LANMSHELRTPLNSIIGFAQLLDRDGSLPQKQQSRIETISRSSQHLLSLINNILDISKIEAGKITINENSFDLHGLLQDVLNMFSLKTKPKGIVLSLKIAPNVPRLITTDEAKLRQILTNLVANAVKFTREGGVFITVGVMGPAESSEERCELSFEVRDTGTGIAKAERDKLFLPFEQTSSGRATRQGTGLGLSITREFLHQMGGNISVESEIGKGSCFYFRLPVKVKDGFGSLWKSSHEQVVGIANHQTDYRILVVDDLPDNVVALSELLTSVGFLVRQANNGAQAVEICQSWQPHFIWMDLLMPVMDGYEALKRIREMQAIAALTHKHQEIDPKTDPKTDPPIRSVIVAFTASVLTEKKAELLAAGFDDYMVKPYKIADIWATLSQHLDISFVYQSSDLAETPYEKNSSTRSPSEAISREAVVALPAAWLTELHQAASQLKGKQVQQLIAQIQPEHYQIAKLLHSYSEAYQFDQICRWISTIRKDSEVSDTVSNE